MHQVSILVFVELALGHRSPPCLFLLLQCFNPCFRGTCPRTPGRVGGCRPMLPVSILVFVELALGQMQQGTSCKKSYSFNPCFRGTCPRTARRFREARGEGRRFQSLFSWNLPSDYEIRYHTGGRNLVSILVFVELALGL